MHDGKKPSRLVFADKPANRRTAPAAQPEAAPNPLAQQRLLKAQSRSLLGPGLAASLAVAPAKRRAGRLPTSAVAAGVVAALLAPLAVLSTGVWPVVFGSGVVVFAAAAWWLRRRTLRVGAPGVPVVRAATVDDEVLAQLDRAMEAVALELPQDTLQPLLSLKLSLVRVLQADAAGGEVFSMEDRLYVGECLRRYLPDSMAAYLAMPPAQRAAVIDGERSATAVFADQLGLMQAEIDALEQKTHRASGDRLLAQQRFLEAKRRAR